MITEKDNSLAWEVVNVNDIKPITGPMLSDHIQVEQSQTLYNDRTNSLIPTSMHQPGHGIKPLKSVSYQSTAKFLGKFLK